LYRRFRQEKALRFRQTPLIVVLSEAMLFVLGATSYYLIAAHLVTVPNALATVLVFQSFWNALNEQTCNPLQALEFAHFQVMGSLVDQWRQMGQLF
jgi:hypothetical protein